MTGGVAEFQRKHLSLFQKISTDVGLPATVRTNFLTCLDQWNPSAVIEAHFDVCCSQYQFQGSPVALSRGERLGTAQKKRHFKTNFQNQTTPGLPAYTSIQAEKYLNKVLRESNAAAALHTFKRYFGHLRLRPISSAAARIFAFRDPLNPTNPLGGPLQTTFSKLSMPGATAREYVMLAFSPGRSDRVCQPNSLDATFRNLHLFVPGGVTAGGMVEVIATPPLCSDVTDAPRYVR